MQNFFNTIREKKTSCDVAIFREIQMNSDCCFLKQSLKVVKRKTAQENKSWSTGREFKGLSSNSSEILLTLSSGPPAETSKRTGPPAASAIHVDKEAPKDQVCKEMIFINDDLKDKQTLDGGKIENSTWR